MANRNVLETMQAEVYPLNDIAMMLKSLPKMGVTIIKANLHHFHERTLILTQLKILELTPKLERY